MGGGGGQESMLVQNVTKFHKCFLGVRVCLNMCACAWFHTGFEVLGGGESLVLYI